MDAQSTDLAHPGILSLIAAGSEEVVPSGIPYSALDHLDSLDTPEIRAWVAENGQYAIYVMPGTALESEGVPSISVPATADDYELVTSTMPL
ncbi:MAG TPA: hypothetical protein VH372_03900 [Actinospica sp.]|nr:hypothetical protein [Actinospica sp.]